MNKYGIIGALFFVASVAFGYFFNFDGAIIIEIALAGFGLCGVIMSAYKAGRAKNLTTWQIFAVIAAATLGGVLCCFGGVNESIFIELSGATLALIAIIFSAVMAKKNN